MHRKGFDLTPLLPEPEVRERIERYLAGRATSADLRSVEEWAAADPARAELLERIVQAQRVAGAAPELWDTDDAWARLAARLDGSAPAEVVALRPEILQPRRRFFGVALRVAAVGVALLGGVALWQYRADVFGPRETAMKEYAADVGERVRLNLPDGSEIVLGGSSRLWVPERFGGERREVRLEGEAVFDIASDPKRPFLVRTDRATTQVLGTRFAVSAFPADGHVDIAVSEGRVAVLPVVEGAEPEQAQVTAGYALRVGADGVLGDVRPVDAEALLSWTTGGFAFDRASLAEVARTFERRFGVRVTFADSAVAKLRLTADFGNAVDAAEIVRLISLSFDIEVRQTPDGFFLFHPARTADAARVGGRN